MYRMMLDAGAERRDLRSVRIWMSAADIMPEDLASTFKKMGATLAIPGIDLPLGEAIFAEGYGMVELSGIMTVKISPPFSGFGLGEFMGIPLPPYRYRVVDADGRPVPPGWPRRGRRARPAEASRRPPGRGSAVAQQKRGGFAVCATSGPEVPA